LAKFVLSEPLHSDQQPALLVSPARPLLDERVNRFPAAQVEVADAEVGMFGDGQRFLQCWQKF